MAVKNSTGKKKTGVKKEAARSRKAPPPPKKMNKTELVQMEFKRQQDVKRITSVVVFALAVLGFSVAVVEGDGAWRWVHNCYIGLFGFGAYLLPFLSFGVSIVSCLDKKKISIPVKAVETGVLILLVCSLIHVVKFQPGGAYWDNCFQAYREATLVMNGGFFGAMLGSLFLTFGKTAALITNIVLMFVVFMFLTGITLIQLFQSLWTPVKKTGDQLAPAVERFREAREERRSRKFNIDVDLGPEPEADACAEKTDPVSKNRKSGKRETVPEERKKTEAPVDDINEIFKPITSVKKVDLKEEPLEEIIKKAAGAPAAPVVKTEEKSPAPSSKKEKKVPVFDVPEQEEVPGGAAYELPPLEILRNIRHTNGGDVSDELKANAEKLVDTLRSFGVETKICDISRGPTVTRYELKPSAGVKISKITGLSDDIALNLATSGVRIEAPIPNKAAVGIEVPNKISNIVTMRELIDTPEFRKAESKLTAGIGKDISGNCIYCDVAKMPHLLVAGATGAGKSVCINSIIVSILYKAKPDEVKFLMIDPKKVEFTMYSGIPHLLVPVVTDPRKAAGALGWAVSEMLQRYKMFSDSGVKNIKGYNKMAQSDESMKPMPQIVIFIDELADLMMAAPNEVEDSICRLAQMARAAGMHLVIATQRPSVDVITGVIKANIPSRIALTVSSQIDSRTILDASGAEKLLGNGDMLYNPVGLSKPTRVQGCYVTDDEIEELIDYIKKQGQCEYSEEISREIEEKAVVEKKKGATPFDETEEADASDPLLSKAVEIVLELGAASTSVVQRKLKVGYARGARIVDQMEEKGIVGPPDGSKPRKVLITKQQWLEMCARAGDAPEQLPLDENEDGEDDGE